MTSLNSVAEHSRREATKRGFATLEYPSIDLKGTLDTPLLLDEALRHVEESNDTNLSLRLASLLSRHGDYATARALLESVYEREQRRLHSLDSYTREYQANTFAKSFIDALCENQRFDRAAEIASSIKNGGYLSETARFDAFLALARGHSLFGEKDSARALLKEMIEGKGATSDIHQTNFYLPGLVITALEVGEFDLAKQAALRRDPSEDLYQRTAAYLRGAVAATLYAAGQKEEAAQMFAKAIEGPETSIRTEAAEEYMRAARLSCDEREGLSGIEYPEDYVSLWRRREIMIGQALVGYYGRQGEKGLDKMEEAARAYSSGDSPEPAIDAFRTHLDAGRLLRAQDFLISTESRQLLHEQEELWHQLLVAGYRAADRSIIAVAPRRVVENLDSGRLLGADGKLWSLHLSPLAAMHVELGNLGAAAEACTAKFLHEATPETSAAALADGILQVLERRLPGYTPKHKVFPICWLTQVD